MATTAQPIHRRTTASRDEVWAVLADGWVYPGWVVGASRMRAVEPDYYPAVGAKIHHSVGTWPAVLDDETVVIESEPGRRLVLEGKTRPVGTARIVLDLEDSPGGGTRITISEDVSSGPARLIPYAARQALLHARNTETLRRLALLSERATDPDAAAT